jgi:hypothetical protein
MSFLRTTLNCVSRKVRSAHFSRVLPRLSTSSLSATATATASLNSAATTQPKRTFSSLSRHHTSTPQLSCVTNKSCVKTRSFSTHSLSEETLLGRDLDRAFDFRHARVGDTLDIPYELTVDASWRTLWHSAFYQHDRVYTSRSFANHMKLPDALLPFSFMLFMTGSMSHVDDNLEVLDLGFRNAVYEDGAYPEDTFSKKFQIIGMRETSDHRTIVDIHCQLFNQHQKRVFSVDKTLMLPIELPSTRHSRRPSKHPKAPSSQLREHILLNSHLLEGETSASLATLSTDQIVLHGLTKPLGYSMNMALSTLFRMTHPLIFNKQRYGQEPMMPWGLMVGATNSSAARGLYEVMYEEISQATFVNRAAPTDTVGSFSYVTNIHDINENLQEVELQTIGVKNVDVTRTLLKSNIPVSLFDGSLKHADMEKVCAQAMPILSKHIIMTATRKLLRRIPHHNDVFLL